MPSGLDEEGVALRIRGGHARTVRRYVDVHLAAKPDLPGAIDARLDGEAHSYDEPARIARLQIVDVRTRAVELRIDGVAGSVDELLSESAGGDHFPRRIVDCRAGHLVTGTPPGHGTLDRSVAGIAHRLPDRPKPLGELGPHEAHPRLIRVDRG